MNKATKQIRKQAALSAVVLIIAVALNTNILTTPENNAVTANKTIVFAWIGLSKTLLIDDNPEFTSPVRLRNNMSVGLEPGEYYWKTSGISTKRRIIIASEVAISVKQETNNTFSIRNKGNVRALLETIRNQDWSITGAATLEHEEGLNSTINENSTFLASQNE